MNKYRVNYAGNVVSTDEDYSGYKLNLLDEKGLLVSHKNSSFFYLSPTLVKASLRLEGIDVDLLTTRQVLKALKSAHIECTLLLKTKGTEFIADELTGQVKVGKAWVDAKAGETYKVQEDGVEINYRKEFVIQFNDAILDELDAVQQRIRVEQASAKLAELKSE